jgi:Tfp pilus assembly pilus retraction ATPase PilT
VSSTLDATETINRMIDLFASHERVQVRAMLVGTLRSSVW